MACIKAKIATAPLTLALVLALAACGGGGSAGSDTPSTVDPGTETGSDTGGDTGNDGGDTGGGNGTDTGDVPLFSVSNPYAIADATSVDQVQVEDLFVFGDSYSVSRSVRPASGGARVSMQPWHATMQDNGFVSNVENFARSGATAQFSNTANSFARQVEDGRDDPDIPSYFEQSNSYGGNDLTVVYFGYNDLQFFADPSLGSNADPLDAADRSYQRSLDRLIDDGATADDRRVFVTLIHDWDRNPQQNGNPTGQVENWNAKVTAIANDRENVVAVDLYTLFNRIYDNPSRFGFDNVTTVDTANSDDTALYIDADHFGQHGADIIAQVYQHYLTRAWDWSNTLANGQATIDQLNSDIDEGRLVLSLDSRDAEAQKALSFFQVGNSIEPGAGPVSSYDTSIKSLSQDTQSGAGMGMNYRLGQNAQLGLVVGQYRNDNDIEHSRAVSGSDVESQALSVYVDQKLGKFNLDTRLTLADNDYRVSSFDAVVDSHNQASTSGQAMSLRQKVSRAFRTGAGWFQPFADLSFERQEIEGYTLSNSFIADTRFSASDTNDVWAGLGLGYVMDPVKIGHDGRLSFSSGLAYRQSLYRDDYKVTITDTAFGGRENARIDRQSAEQFSLNAQSAFSLGGSWSIGAGYNFAASSEADDDTHSLRADLTFRF